jgi:hypothetical protein
VEPRLETRGRGSCGSEPYASVTYGVPNDIDCFDHFQMTRGVCVLVGAVVLVLLAVGIARSKSAPRSRIHAVNYTLASSQRLIDKVVLCCHPSAVTSSGSGCSPALDPSHEANSAIGMSVHGNVQAGWRSCATQYHGAQPTVL